MQNAAEQVGGVVQEIQKRTVSIRFWKPVVLDKRFLVSLVPNLLVCSPSLSSSLVSDCLFYVVDWNECRILYLRHRLNLTE